VSFETPIQAIEGPQTYALNRTAAGVNKYHNSLFNIPMSIQKELIENYLPMSMQKELIENYLRYGHMLSKSFARRGM